MTNLRDLQMLRTQEFVRLFSLHQPRIFAFVLAMLPHRADAEEVMQETSVMLWQRFEEFRPDTNFRAWACQVARFKVLEYRRRQSQQSAIQFSDELLSEVADQALKQADSLDLRRVALLACLQKLHLRDRDLLERRVNDVTVQQISQEVGRPVGGLYKAFQRIYQTLHECIDRAISRETRL